ncbi:MAG TPA: hypothetical protein DCQ34_04440 [Chitinophagaceae bacterium]|nr:hypothetical protein [Chitinophagaceae bacterium]HRF25703.1 hypothetical protein [Ferruginibacter sp.]
MKYVFCMLMAGLLGMQSQLSAQALSYVDPAISYQRILLEKSGEGSYKQIGNFKVIGTPYLYGNSFKGNVYTPAEKAENADISYNTYNQQVEVVQSGATKPLMMSLQDVDSFKLIIKDKNGTPEVLSFINASQVDKSKKLFMQEVYNGKRFSLLKAYSSTMGYVSTNYVQSELRQFDLIVDYYYFDVQKPGIKKLKISAKNLKSEFSSVADISAITSGDDFEKNTEFALKEIFALLNSK